MGLLEVESSLFETAEEHFDVPSQFVIIHRLVRRMVCEQNDVLIGCSKPDYVHIKPPNLAFFVEDTSLLKTVATEESSHVHPAMAAATTNLCVVSDANPKGDVPFEQVFEPVLTDKLPVCGDTLNVSKRENLKKSLHQVNALLHIRASSFVQKRPKDGDTDTFVSDTKNHEVDVLFAEFPVCTVNAENPFVSDWHEFDDDLGEVLKVEEVASEKSLYSLIMGLDFCFSPEFLG